MEKTNEKKKQGFFNNQHKLKTIGFLGCGTLYSIFRKQWPGILRACEKYNVNLLYIAGEHILNDVSYSTANILYDLVKTEDFDGLICWASTMFANLTPEEQSNFLAKYKPLPIVSLGQVTEGIPSLVQDSYEGLYEVMTHLIKVHGYKRIAIIRADDHFYHARVRFQAYNDALQAYGLPVDPALITNPDSRFWEIADGMAGIQELFDERKLQPKKDIEAIVAMNDRIALGAIQALQARGIKVPWDIAITGFNDDAESQVTTPSLTTVKAPLFELGEQVIESILALISGKSVPMENQVPTKLVVRQSCGCLSEFVSHAASLSLTQPDEKIEVSLTTKRNEILEEMTRSMAHLMDAREWVNQFIDAFLETLNQGNPKIFLSALIELIRLALSAGSSPDIWHEALSIFIRYAGTCFKERERSILVENLWQQARTEIGEASKRAQGFQELLNTQITEALQRIGGELITTFDLPGLMDILFKSLPKIGISTCYLAMYEDSKAPTEWARLILAFNEKGRIALDAGNERFPSAQIAPRHLLPDKPRNIFLLQALFFQKEQIGFILVDAEQRESSMYEILRRDISSALYGAMLVKRVQEHAAKVARQKYILDTFMETVPDRIWFKDQVGRFTRMNKAHAHRLGLQKPGEEVGKTEAEIRGKEIGQRVSADEQKIMETGQPILNKEVEIIGPSGNPDWSLVTKMPLHDENGMIIGTFGISRDITELKQIEQALEKANQEITKLNVNLTDENQRMHMEMDLARRIQTALLPRMVKNVHPDFEIAALMMPAAEVGGDYYDISLDRENNLWFNIGDVSGHGVTPGLIMMMAQTIHTTITVNYQATARDMLININKVLVKNVTERMGNEHLMTFTTLKYLGAGRFQYAGRHLDLIIYRNQTKTCENIETTGIFLNYMPDLGSYTKNEEFAMDKGDMLVLYTDGITESANSKVSEKREMLGLIGFMEIVQRHGELDIDICRDAIIADVLRWSGSVQEDDISLVLVKRIK